MSIDPYLFNLINGLAGKWKLMDSFGIFFAKHLAYFLVAFLALFSFFTKEFEVFLIPVLSALFARVAVNESIYFFYKRKRPLEVLNIKALVKKPNYPSFPSGHSSAFFALSFALLPYNITLAIIFLTAACLIVISRIFAGLHWPSDVLAGVIAGIFSSLIVHLTNIIIA